MTQFNRSLRRKVAFVGLSAATVLAAGTTVAPAANALLASGTVAAQHAMVTPPAVSVNADDNDLIPGVGVGPELLDPNGLLRKLAPIGLRLPGPQA